MAPSRGVTVAGRSVAGPRHANEDRYSTYLDPADGSWVVAVADGLGGHDRGAEAAEAAIADLPRRVDSADSMWEAFIAAADRVAALAPPGATPVSEPRRCPMAALYVAAWTPPGGLVVGWMGDVVAVQVRWRPETAPTGRLLGRPHRFREGGLSHCLGYDDPRRRVGVGLAAIAEPLDPGDESTVVVASDGVWEALLWGRNLGRRWGVSDIGDRVAAAATAVPVGGAADIAERILDAAGRAGLDDDATVAVSHTPAPPAPPCAAPQDPAGD